MDRKLSGLRRAAAAALTHDDLLAWHEPHRRRTREALALFAQGELGAAELRAAIGASARSPSTSPAAIAVVPLVGVLTPGDSFFSLFGLGTSLATFRHQVRTAAQDATIAALVIPTDSPGGFVTGAVETAQLLREVRDTKPVVATITGLAASCAYWIIANAQRIEATPSGNVGSIGVYVERVSLARQLEADGIDVAVVSAGKYKTEGHEALPMTTDERQFLQARVDECYASFVGDVARGRSVSVATVRRGYGEGRVVSADTARHLGMIDAIALPEDTVARALAPAPTSIAAHRQALMRTQFAGHRLALDFAAKRMALARVSRADVMSARE